MKPRVVFTTTVFDEVATGPGIYAQYLWRAFADDPDIEFHLVAPRAGQSHPQLHTLGDSVGGSLYERIGRTALQVTAGGETGTILHGNAAHACFQFLDYTGPWIVQVNDYEVAQLPSHVLGTLLSKGPRRLASLVWRRRQEKRVIPAATRAVCNSEFTRQAVLDAYDVSDDRAVTIHKAVDTSRFVRPRTLPPDPLPQRAAGARLAMVGTNWDIKGLDILLRAMTDLSADVPQVTLTVAGSTDLPRNARMVALAGRLGVTDRVHFVGRLDRDDVARLLWHSDVLVMPSRQEGFGVAALEGMAAGVAVVASRVGGLAEIISDESLGVLCEPRSPAVLRAALRSLLGDDARRTRLAQAGPARAETFNTDRMIQAVRALYHELAA